MVIAHALAQLTPADRVALRTGSASNLLWRRLEWLHNKYYRDNPPNDGQGFQQPWNWSDPKSPFPPEIPYRRRLFYPSRHSRFSLGEDGPVAYFSNDFGMNCCETIEQFHDNAAVRFEDLARYLQGQGNPIPGVYGYPMSFHLAADTVVLDLSTPSTLFFRLLDGLTASVSSRAVWGVVTSREPHAKLATQHISLQARESGFDGIVYTSVRAPVDVNMPDQNLVVFSPERVHPGPPPTEALDLPASYPVRRSLHRSGRGFARGQYDRLSGERREAGTQ